MIGAIPAGASESPRYFVWVGTVSARTWLRYETVYLLLAGLATPLVFSVHSIVSMDFATSVIPGWHTTIFPPYFVAGAIFSGLAMVLALMLIARKVMNLENYITRMHIDKMCKLMLSMGCIVGLAYGTEFFTAFYSGNGYEQFVFKNRALGPFAWAYWTMVFVQRADPAGAVVEACAAIIGSGLCHRDCRKYRHVVRAVCDHRHQPEFATFCLQAGRATRPPRSRLPRWWVVSACFFTCFLIFCRIAPVIAMAEVKSAAHLKPNTDAPAKPWEKAA